MGGVRGRSRQRGQRKGQKRACEIGQALFFFFLSDQHAHIHTHTHAHARTIRPGVNLNAGSLCISPGRRCGRGETQSRHNPRLISA
ncbi:hypothetical protein IF1G_08548 [Cordyceps javanica]|uniref:Uncharacterized protein n=1 Tax=Cordyceps javanica TaxID=43265 RepID=A0A545UT26_9HYPO|nr:hypothetical protein IF1G_08548 [Cordyceps javanica]